tara:strand:+ start:95 stop:826 length:732 start_codon:yes stop_codon:yes gene_type:complete
MIWILPMAGKGTRTESLGEFKPFIKVNNKKIIEWFLIGIKKKIKKNDTIFFITTNYFEKKFNFQKTIKKVLKKNKINTKKYFFKFIDKTPNGPAYTVNSIKYDLKNSKTPCTVINPDQYIDFHLPKKILFNNLYFPLHFNNHGNSSYVKLNKSKYIIEIMEKNLISTFASSGVYIFGSTILLKKILNLIDKFNLNKEVNMSELINIFFKKYKRQGIPVSTYSKYDLGNVKSIQNFPIKKINID